jgi:DNA-binding PadR family transcriptional regulator
MRNGNVGAGRGRRIVGSFREDMARMSTWEIQWLAALSDGLEKTSEQIRETIGWRAAAGGLRWGMRRLEDRGFITTDRRSVVGTCSDGAQRGRRENWYQLTKQGDRALRDIRDFVVRQINPQAKAGKLRPGQVSVAQSPRTMTPHELRQLLLSDAPEEFKLLARATQTESLGDARLTVSEAASIEYGEADWNGHPNRIDVGFDPRRRRSVRVTPALHTILRDAAQLRMHSLVFATLQKKRWCDASYGASRNRNLFWAFRQAVKKARLGGRGIKCPGKQGHGRVPTASEEKRILKHAGPEFRLFYLAVRELTCDWTRLAAITWSIVEFGDRHATLRISKTERVRVSGELLEALESARKRHFSGPLFSAPKWGRWEHKGCVGWYWRRYKRKLGFPREVEFHRWWQKAEEVSATNGEDTAAIETADAVRIVGKTDHVELFSDGTAVIDGVRMPKLTNPQYRVVSALVRTDDHRLLKDDLIEKSDGADALNVLRRLSRKQRWKDVIRFPLIKGEGYRIA